MARLIVLLPWQAQNFFNSDDKWVRRLRRADADAMVKVKASIMVSIDDLIEAGIAGARKVLDQCHEENPAYRINETDIAEAPSRVRKALDKYAQELGLEWR